jgi:hypothetical protein
MPVPCLRAGLLLFSLLNYGMCYSVCGWFVSCVVWLLSVDRAFEPIEGSYLVCTFGRAVTVTPSVTRPPLFLVVTVVLCRVYRSSLVCGKAHGSAVTIELYLSSSCASLVCP